MRVTQAALDRQWSPALCGTYMRWVRLVWRDLPGDGWSLHEYPANERVASPVLLVQSVQRSAHFGAFWAAAAFNRWPRHDRLLKPSSTELGR
jgi:hypothetical protein